MLPEAQAIGGVVVSQAQPLEAPAVVFFEMQNPAGTSTLHVTLRCNPGEDELNFMNRVNGFILAVDAKADVNWVLKDASRGYAKGSGGSFSGAKKVDIQGGQFVIKFVTRYEKPNKDPNKGNWSYLRAFGEQNGQEVSADCFVGSVEWQKPGNAVTACGQFPNFFSWKLDERKAIPADRILTAKVAQHPQYKTWEITEIVISGM